MIDSSITAKFMCLLLGFFVTACAQPENQIPSDKVWIPSEYGAMPHHRALANLHCTIDAIAGYAAWNAPTAEAAIGQAIEECEQETAGGSPINATECQVCWIGDTLLIGLTEREIEQAITVYNANNFATSLDMVGRVNPVTPPKTLEELRKLIRESYELNNERGILRY